MLYYDDFKWNKISYSKSHEKKMTRAILKSSKYIMHGSVLSNVSAAQNIQ